jgi:hypothetical protein
VSLLDFIVRPLRSPGVIRDASPAEDVCESCRELRCDEARRRSCSKLEVELRRREQAEQAERSARPAEITRW